MVGHYPQLGEKTKEGGVSLKIRLYKYTKISQRILNIGGGTGDLGKFIQLYHKECKKFKAPGMLHPVILLIDNDDGAKKIYGPAKNIINKTIDGTEPFYFICHNLYLVPTPLLPGKKTSMIEDFFEPKVKETKLGGKSLNLNSTGFDNRTEYGKYLFAEQVVKKNEEKINFDGFKPILTQVIAVVNEHSKKTWSCLNL